MLRDFRWLVGPFAVMPHRDKKFVGFRADGRMLERIDAILGTLTKPAPSSTISEDDFDRQLRGLRPRDDRGEFLT
jgi:hypothetical protein